MNRITKQKQQYEAFATVVATFGLAVFLGLIIVSTFISLSSYSVVAYAALSIAIVQVLVVHNWPGKAPIMWVAFVAIITGCIVAILGASPSWATGAAVSLIGWATASLYYMEELSL